MLSRFKCSGTVRNGSRALVVSILIAASICAQDAPTIEVIQQTIESGNLDEASRQLAAALRASPRDAGLLNLQGVVHAERKEYREARQNFERAVALAPDLIPAWRNLGRTCQMMIAANSAAPDCAAAAWKRVLASEGSDPEARFSLAAVYESEGKYAASIDEIKKLPDEEARRAPALILQCADLAGLGRVQEAVGLAHGLGNADELSESDAVSILPLLASRTRAPVRIALLEALDARALASPATLRQLVSAYESVGRLDDGRRLLERMASRDPNNPQHLLELARIAYLQHDLEGSLGYLGHARDLTPADAQVHFLFGMVLEEMKLPFEARKSVEKALALAPGNPDYSYALATILLATRNASDAIPLLKTYIQARPGDARGHLALGIAYFGASQYDECRAEVLGIMDDSDTGGGAAYLLGRVERISENFDDAARALNHAIRRMPSFAPAYAELARVRLEQGRLEDTKAAIGRALALDPEDFQANSTLLKLYSRTKDPRLPQQYARVQKLDAARNEKEAQLERLMLRGIEVKPY